MFPAEGVNGLLPNLDLVQVVLRLCELEGVATSFHTQVDLLVPDTQVDLLVSDTQADLLVPDIPILVGVRHTGRPAGARHTGIPAGTRYGLSVLTLVLQEGSKSLVHKVFSVCISRY